MLRSIIILALLFFISIPLLNAQNASFTRQDTLRGSITAERAWWDLLYYDLNIKVNIPEKKLSGYNIIRYKTLKQGSRLQLDLQPPMQITSITSSGIKLPYEKDGNAWFVHFENPQTKGETHELKVYFSGKPKVANRPPWDATITWQKDENGKPFIATACQGDGASMWWPCKDHMYDEPDSMHIRVTVPKDLMDVSNGRLQKVEVNDDNTKTYHWFVSNPINNYGVNINIGDYVHFSEKYKGEKGILDCDYYVLRDNLKVAKKQFEQATMTLEAFEHWFGPYPFYEDSYKLVEVPYLGMEHQSSVTYGNKYQNGYLGRDLSNSGWGLKFDFIIVHESGHEWFANSITNKDIADMWIHESFTAYSENLYLDYHFGKQASSEYVLGTRSSIRNDRPIIGPYNVNKSGSGSDMYYKGSNMLHTLRQLINDDEKWRAILRGLNKDFFHQTVSSADIENYISQKSEMNLKLFFDQYLRDVRIPVLEYRVRKNKLHYRWSNTIPGFNMPVRIFVDQEERWLHPTQMWRVIENVESGDQIKVDPNFYVGEMRLTNK